MRRSGRKSTGRLLASRRPTGGIDLRRLGPCRGPVQPDSAATGADMHSALHLRHAKCPPARAHRRNRHSGDDVPHLPRQSCRGTSSASRSTPPRTWSPATTWSSSRSCRSPGSKGRTAWFSVELLEPALSPRMRQIFNTFVALFSSLVYGVLAWTTGRSALQFLARNLCRIRRL